MRRAVIALGLFLGSLCATAGPVVVLKGGTVIPLKEPWVQKGSSAILTRADGTLFSVPISEIDQAATSALSQRGPASAGPVITPPPESPADAARTKGGAKAKVRITDADVSHQPLGTSEGEAKEAGPAAAAGGASVEVAEYRDQRTGKLLGVRGTLRNVGQVAALSTRLTISALDDKGEVIATTQAGIGDSRIEPGHDVSFATNLDVGDKVVASIRFRPIWVAASSAPKGTAAAPSRNGASSSGTEAAPAPSPAPSAAPAPVPTPYGRGLLYAPPAAATSTSPSADGKTGYLPGATHKEDQPKPPQ